jgi:hypothetical protein
VVRLPSKQPLMLLRFLLSSDVHHDADEVGRLAVLVFQALATRLDPADGSVLSRYSWMYFSPVATARWPR